MKRGFLLCVIVFFSVQVVLSASVNATTTIVEVGEEMGWEILGFTSNDVTYPALVYFRLEFRNSGTLDINVSGNLTIRKAGSVVYVNKVFSDGVSSQEYKNFTFSWIPSETGDFIANLTINITNNVLNQTNITFSTSSFTVYSPPPPPPSNGGSPPSYSPVPPVVTVTRTWDEILPGVSVTLKIENEQFAFSEIIIEVSKESQGVRVEVIKLDQRPGSIDKDPPGKTYRYLEVKHENLEGNVRSVAIIFRVGNEWISENEIDKYSITLNRYSSGRWEIFPAKFLSEDSVNAYYGAEVPGLSVFSITGEERTACVPGERRCSDGGVGVCSSGGSWETGETCEHGCLGGECVEVIPAVCTPGDVKCLGDFLQRCSGDGSGWESFEKCEYGCWDGECKGMVVSYVTRTAVFVMFAILVTILIIMIALVYMNLRAFVLRKR